MDQYTASHDVEIKIEPVLTTDPDPLNFSCDIEPEHESIDIKDETEFLPPSYYQEPLDDASLCFTSESTDFSTDRDPLELTHADLLRGVIESELVDIKQELQAIPESSFTESVSSNVNESHLIAKFQLRQCYVPLHRVSESLDHALVRCDRSTPSTSKLPNGGKSFSYKRNTKRIQTHRPRNIFTCSHCGRCFEKKLYLIHHIANDHSVPSSSTKTNALPFTCDQCGRSFKLRDYLVRHITCHLNKLPCNKCICDHCGVSFQGRLNLVRHIHKHHDTVIHSSKFAPTFTCNECGKSWKKKQAIIQHITHSYHNNKPKQCEHCGHLFLISCGIKKHFMEVHGIREEFECQICDNVYNSLNTFREHKKVHSATPPACKICEKVFSTFGSLKQHLDRKHNDDITSHFKCPTCGKTSGSKSDHLLHRQTHTKLFKCNICAKSFTRKFYYQEHLLMHAGKFNYKCEHCSKSYVSVRQYNLHVRTHTHRVQCEFCEVTCSTQSNLKAHIKWLHKKKIKKRS